MGQTASRLYHQYEPAGDDLTIVPARLRVPVHAEALQLHRYWLRCEAAGGLKVGRDLPSREIARLMSKLGILEPNAERTDFRFRLVGSGWLQRFGRDIKGEWLSSLYDAPTFEHYRTGLRNVLDTGAPTFTDVHVYRDGIEQHHIEYIELPVLSFDASTRCILIGAFRFE